MNGMGVKAMSETMNFPETFDEFAENYKITDDKQVYTKRTELIPIFRVRQWLMRPDKNAKTVEQIKSEAVKEFAERLKEMSTQGFWETDAYVGVEQIDSLLKEIVSDDNDTSSECTYSFDNEVSNYCVQSSCPNFKTKEEIELEAIKKFANQIQKAIIEAIKRNEEVITERVSKHNINPFEDTFCCNVYGKNTALVGINSFIGDILEEKEDKHIN